MRGAIKAVVLALLASATVVGCLALGSGVALANFSPTYSLPTGGDQWWTSSYGCSDIGTAVDPTGVGQNNTGNGYVVQTFGMSGAPALPSGAYWVGQTVSGTITNGNPSYPGTSTVGIDYTFGCINAPYSGFGYVAGTSGSAVSLGPGTSSVNYRYSLTAPWDEAVAAAQPSGWATPGIVVGGGPSNYGYSTSNDTTTFQYAYVPTGIVAYQESPPTGSTDTQATISWNPNGNDSGTTYTLQREALQGGAVVGGWATMYQGTATSVTTTSSWWSQSCGYGYVYRVRATGPSALTPWDTSAQWDEFPCTASVVGATPTSVTESWPQVTAQTVPYIVWCEIGTPAGGASCQQQRFDIGAGDTSATITGLVPNAEYMVWACSLTNAWGCPDAVVWTYAATPTLSLNNNTAGLAYDQQPLTWTTGGNAPGTVYCLQQGTYAQ
jgi:hypothetical protein